MRASGIMPQLYRMFLRLFLLAHVLSSGVDANVAVKRDSKKFATNNFRFIPGKQCISVDTSVNLSKPFGTAQSLVGCARRMWANDPKRYPAEFEYDKLTDRCTACRTEHLRAPFKAVDSRIGHYTLTDDGGDGGPKVCYEGASCHPDNGACVEVNDKMDFKCDCYPGFTGSNCESSVVAEEDLDEWQTEFWILVGVSFSVLCIILGIILCVFKRNSTKWENRMKDTSDLIERALCDGYWIDGIERGVRYKFRMVDGNEGPKLKLIDPQQKSFDVTKESQDAREDVSIMVADGVKLVGTVDLDKCEICWAPDDDTWIKVLQCECGVFFTKVDLQEHVNDKQSACYASKIVQCKCGVFFTKTDLQEHLNDKQSACYSGKIGEVPSVTTPETLSSSGGRSTSTIARSTRSRSSRATMDWPGNLDLFALPVALELTKAADGLNDTCSVLTHEKTAKQCEFRRDLANELKSIAPSPIDIFVMERLMRAKGDDHNKKTAFIYVHLESNDRKVLLASFHTLRRWAQRSDFSNPPYRVLQHLCEASIIRLTDRTLTRPSIRPEVRHADGPAASTTSTINLLRHASSAGLESDPLLSDVDPNPMPMAHYQSPVIVPGGVIRRHQAASRS